MEDVTFTEKQAKQMIELQQRKQRVRARMKEITPNVLLTIQKSARFGNFCHLPPDLPKRLCEQIQEVAQQRALASTFQQCTFAHQVAGCMIFPILHTMLAIRIETFYEGKYRECRYVILNKHKSALIVHRHTLPFFIPVKSIAEQYLNYDFSVFVGLLRDNLWAFVNRSNQLTRARRLVYTQNQNSSRSIMGPPPQPALGSIWASPACDFFSFSLPYVPPDRRRLRLRISYPTLLSQVPHEANAFLPSKKDDKPPRSLPEIAHQLIGVPFDIGCERVLSKLVNSSPK